ncbi:MAG: phytanoyl-CoA dioxygenase family protein [Anaerolineae bacterium]|nr:phytanoyl-CoA dioxygenase family protein [Anaerolineae bacterium]
MTTSTEPATRLQYESDGFTIHSQPLLPKAVVEAAIEGMDAVRAGQYETGIPPQPSSWNPGDDPSKLCKIEMPQITNRSIMELVSHPALGELAAAITGASMVQVWWVQLLYKPPVENSKEAIVGYHQDRQYWNVWDDDSELFTAWVALSDVRSDCGPMNFVPGSHRWGLLNQGDFFQDKKNEIQVPEGEVWSEVTATLPPGGVSFHHCLTFHGSGPNYSSRPRRSFAIHLRTDKSRPRHDPPEGLARFIDNPDYCPIIFGK